MTEEVQLLSRRAPPLPAIRGPHLEAIAKPSWALHHHVRGETRRGVWIASGLAAVGACRVDLRRYHQCGFTWDITIWGTGRNDAATVAAGRVIHLDGGLDIFFCFSGRAVVLRIMCCY